jgi:hypothetical protein
MSRFLPYRPKQSKARPRSVPAFSFFGSTSFARATERSLETAVIRRFIPGMFNALKADSKLFAVVPRHAAPPDFQSGVAAQLGKGGVPPVASLPVPPQAANETLPVSAASSSAAIAPPLPRNRSGSNRRQRGAPVSIRLLPEERAEIETRAREAGLSIGSYLRACALGSPGLRAKRSPPVNAEALARAVAELNKVGSNLNQIAKVLNAGRAVGSREALATLAETRAVVAQILEIVGRKERHDSQRNDSQ